MKTLNNNILLYDSSCPLCRVYSQGFIAAGMLDQHGRMDYSQRSPEISQLIDADRARNEIALVNVEEKSVKYGIHSLFLIISNSLPALSILFNSRKFTWVMKKIYAFVSYNRRVIICGTDPENPNACNPDFNLNYRIAYLIFTILVSSFILMNFSPILNNYIPFPQGGTSEISIVAGQIIFQILLLLTFGKKLNLTKVFDYTGNVMTVSFMGSLLLLPALVFHKMVPDVTESVYLLYFGLIIIVMFFEHKKRVKVYQLPKILSYSWVGYPLIVLAVNYYFGNY